MPPQYPPPNSIGKVAIPRLGRPVQEYPETTKQRIKLACITCRKRKMKCSGHRPRCQQCLALDMECVYGTIRADRLRDTAALNHDLVALLRDLRINLGATDKRRVDDLLLSAEDVFPRSIKAKPDKGPGPSDAEDDGSPTSQCVGPNDSFDVLDEDVFRSRESADTGYVGPHSEVQWLRSLRQPVLTRDNTSNEYQQSLSSQNTPDSPVPPKRTHALDFTFYLDHESLDVDTPVDENVLPHPDIADRLFECYMNTIHTSFPVLGEDFEDQFHQIFTAIRQQRPLQVPKCWQARANFIFAIGARYSHLLNASWRGDVNDHRVYMARGVRLIGLDPSEGWILRASPSLAVIQATALLSLYYLVVGHASKSWVMIGISLRFALSVGLHLRNEDKSASEDQKEALIRTWWCLHAIECLLSTTTGRPCIMATDDCTVPLPQTPTGGRFAHISGPSSASLRPGSSSSSRPPTRARQGSFVPSSLLYNRASIDLITHRAIALLYSPTSKSKTWAQTQKIIIGLMDDLDNWVAVAFPNGLAPADFTQSSRPQREQLLLAFSLFSAKILVTRPCLLRLERSNPANFSQKTSDACLEAALNLSRLLPDQPDATWIYNQGPWWCIIHNIMQATAVFLLETCRNGASAAYTYPQHLRCLAKLVRWLQSLSSHNGVAKRACHIVRNILTNEASPSMAEVANLIEPEIVQAQPAQLFSEEQSNPNPWQSDTFQNTDSMDLGADLTQTVDPGSLPSVTEQMQFTPDLYPGQEFGSYFAPQTAQTYGISFLTSFDKFNQLVFGANNQELGADAGFDDVYVQNPEFWQTEQG